MARAKQARSSGGAAVDPMPDWGQLDFPVELRSVAADFTPDGSDKRQRVTVPNHKAVMRVDTGEVLAVVSGRYGLVPHRQVFEPLAQAVERIAIPVLSVDTHVASKGGTARVMWTLDHEFTVRRGDKVQLRLVARNSLDRTSRLGIELGGFRLVCKNGLMVGKAFQYSRKHTAGLSVDAAVGIFQDMLDKGPALMSQWESWTGHPTTTEFLAEAIAPSPYVPKGALDEIVERFEKEKARSVWDAYNAITWYATHRLATSTRISERLPARQERLHRVAIQFAERAMRN